VDFIPPVKEDGNESDDAHMASSSPPPLIQNRSNTSEERQGDVGQVLDLLQVAESGLLAIHDPGAIVEAVRSISAVKAISAFLNQNAVANEATLILERCERMGTLGEGDRAWLLIAVDRLRLLTVDPHHSSAPKTLLIPVAMAHLERLITVVKELSRRLSQNSDDQVAELLAELRISSQMLLRIPVAPLVARLQVHALRFERVLIVRGDDLALASEMLRRLQKILPSLITAAAREKGCSPQLTLVFLQRDRELVVRLACDCLIVVPAMVVKTLRDCGSLSQDDGILSLRLRITPET
jgi:hypothetical protein